jgi:UPF0755 protein
MKKAALFGIVVVFLIVSGTATLLWTRFLNSPASDSNEEIVYEVVPGKTFARVSKELESQKIISNSALFNLFARLRGQSSKMKVGEYLFRPNMRPLEVLEVLTSGKSIGRNFTVSEGLNIYEIAELVASTGISTRDEFLQLTQDPQFVQSLLGEAHPSLEGYLYPETYQVTKYTELKTLVRSMVQKFLHVYASVEPTAKAMGWSRHQVVTLASIIEKETGAPEERPLISSIFHNRLSKGMMLQTDPTVLYAKMLKTKNPEISITRLDLMMDDDYNTYKRKGLPPGPIANPGSEALRAAVNPAKSEYLFFVSQNNGTHIFSKDYSDHQKAVMRFQLDPKARDGKSWRDLKKSKSH